MEKEKKNYRRGPSDESKRQIAKIENLCSGRVTNLQEMCAITCCFVLSSMFPEDQWQATIDRIVAGNAENIFVRSILAARHQFTPEQIFDDAPLTEEEERSKSSIILSRADLNDIYTCKP